MEGCATCFNCDEKGDRSYAYVFGHVDSAQLSKDACIVRGIYNCIVQIQKTDIDVCACARARPSVYTELGGDDASA